ncbi:MAG: hypothetical protein GEU95_13640 [Rhizobiales bacterium]|nr:hypothetical protein [Hyphomicrobiales bacterium]
MSAVERTARPFPPQSPGKSSAAEPRETAINEFQDQAHIAQVASRLERLEHLALASAQQPRPPWREAPPPRPDYADSHFDPAAGAALLRTRRNNPGINPWLFVMATALNTMVAAVLAVIITLGVVRQDRPEAQARENPIAAAAYTGPPSGHAGDAAMGTQPLSLRPIGSPSQPLRLEARRPSRLPLQIQPEHAALEPFIAVLNGAPAGTALSGATRIGADTWFLPPGSASNLEITLPEWSSTPFEVAIELRRTNGQVAGQTKAWLAVPPPGGAQATGTAGDQGAAKDLLAQGHRLIERGEIVAARSVYQRAAEMGNGDAALALGSTYDPNRLWSLGALGMVGSKERAKHWYARADELGHGEAKGRLRLLGN